MTHGSKYPHMHTHPHPRHTHARTLSDHTELGNGDHAPLRQAITDLIKSDTVNKKHIKCNLCG